MRRTPQSLRRHLPLLLLTLLLTPLIPTLTLADSGDDAPLGPTQIAGDLPPPETDGTAIIQWGGGSLYQLTARLAVNGCDLNLLWVYDDQAQQYTAAYTFDGPSFLNAPFNRRYGENIPPSTLWVKCIDMLQHVYGYGLLNDEQKAWVDGQDKGDPFELPNNAMTACTDQWMIETANLVIGFLPLIQGTCVAHLQEESGGVPVASNAIYPFQFYMLGGKLFVYYGTQSTILINASAHYERIDILHNELHESCHVHQNWVVAKSMLTYDSLRKASQAGGFPKRPLLLSDYLLDFIGVVGFAMDGEGAWRLPSDSRFSMGIYGSHRPRELSAELCAAYMIKKLDRTKPDDNYHEFERYLAGDVIDWLEEYVFVLPDARLSEEQRWGYTLSGVVHGATADLEVRACWKGSWRCESANVNAAGAFSRALQPGMYTIRLSRGEQWFGVYAADAPGNLTTDHNAATIINLAEDITGIEITLP